MGQLQAVISDEACADDNWGNSHAVREYLEAIDEDNTQTRSTRKISPIDPAVSYTAYGTVAMLNWVVKTKQIEPHTPVWQKYEGTAGLFGMADFTWDAEADRYTCPAGKTLQRYRRKFKKKRAGSGRRRRCLCT